MNTENPSSAHTLHVISHTHWDREWYLTFQQFRMRLVDLVDHVLDLLERDPDYRYFNLDAQTIVLEDYLAIKPQNRARLERFIREGRITIGPWYQLNDEFLTSGESTIRSLLVGHRIAQQFGACMKIGYLPDQFGNLSQMPQIFRGFGIDNAILGRGYQLVGDRKMEFLWQSPDGSEVTASLMAFWYNNAQRFPADPEAALRYTEAIYNRMAPRSAVSHLLLMNGVDHLEAQQNLSPILAGLQNRLPDGSQIVHSTLPQYMDAVKAEVQAKNLKLETHVGELREDRGGACLAGTLSSRMYLKQANHHAQNTLEKYAEPFSAFAMQTGAEYPYDFLHYAWKLLMQNHPHDSICGCSVDQVHREMMPRFAQVEQIGEELIARALSHLADRIQPTAQTAEAVSALVVFNSLNWPRTDPVITTLEFPLGIPTRGNPPRDDSKQLQGFTLTDETGAEIPFAVTNIAVEMRQVLSPVELPLDQWVQKFTIEFVAKDVPACGYKSYNVLPRPAMPNYPKQNANRYLRYPSLCVKYEDVGDVGDEYLHKRPLQDEVFMECSPIVYSLQSNAVCYTNTLENDLMLPINASADGQTRSGTRLPCRIKTNETRWAGVPRKEYKTTFNNLVRDHRLRVLVTTYLDDVTESAAEGQFDVIRRPIKHPLEAEGALPFHPQQSWFAFRGNKKSEDTSRSETITIINQGLPEYEIYSGEDSGEREIGFTAAVTLLRCVGYLSRRGDGPQFETPEAQCPGEHEFHFAILETDGDWQSAKVWKQAHQFNVPLRAVQTNIASEQERPLPPSLSFLKVEPDQLVVTAFKRAEDNPTTLIVRFFNITEEPVSDGKVTLRGAQSARLVNLNEETQQELTLQKGGSVTLDAIRPKQIVTLAFSME